MLHWQSDTLFVLTLPITNTYVVYTNNNFDWDKSKPDNGLQLLWSSIRLSRISQAAHDTAIPYGVKKFDGRKYLQMGHAKKKIWQAKFW